MRSALLAALPIAVALAGQARPCLAAEEAAPLAAVAPPVAPPPHRFTLTPSWTHAFAQRSASFDALGLNLQTLLGKESRFGIGLTGALYSPFTHPSLASPNATPTNETLGSLLAEFSWRVVHGARVELSILHGIGTIATRPLSLVDPAHRTFSYDPLIAFSNGAALRVYLARDVALCLDARNLVYVERRERGPLEDSFGTSVYGGRPLMAVLETRLGLTVYFSERNP